MAMAKDTEPPPPSTSSATMTMKPSPPAPFPSDGGSAPITTEHLALIGFAARLGTCVNNDAGGDYGDDDQEDDESAPGAGGRRESVRDEAMLLMNLLMGEKAPEMLAEEIGAKEKRRQRRRRRRTGGASGSASSPRGGGRSRDEGAGNFSFTFPLLSLQPDNSSPAGPSSGPSGGEVSGASTPTPTVSDSSQDTQEEEASRGDLPPPSQLLRRSQCVRDKDSIRDSAESMARNVLESFGTALAWRAKTWIKSLANVLALKERERVRGLRAKGVSGDEEREGGSSGAEGDDAIANSREMQIIDAIVRSSEEVSVVNVKTAFRVLPNGSSSPRSPTRSLLLGGGSGSGSPKGNVSFAFPVQAEQGHASKKAKTSPSSSPGRNDDDPANDPAKEDEYHVTHRLLFEATVSMTSNDGVRYNGIKLQAPGRVRGTFSRSNATNTSTGDSFDGGAGEETLAAVAMALDTDALALSLERQSRLVVRRAAESALLAAGGMDRSDLAPAARRTAGSPRVYQSVISPRYVLMSPEPMARYHPYPEGGGALPQVPSVGVLAGEAADEREGKAAVVSSGEDPSSDSSSSAGTLSSSAGTNGVPSAGYTLQPSPSKRGTASRPLPAGPSPSFPALLSVANEELSRGD